MAPKQTQLSFEQSYKKLEELVSAFEEGKFDLDEAIIKFEDGLQIAADLKKRLKSMEIKVTEVKRKFTKDIDIASED